MRISKAMRAALEAAAIADGSAASLQQCLELQLRAEANTIVLKRLRLRDRLSRPKPATPEEGEQMAKLARLAELSD